jgi:hypothetical protein
MPEQFEKLVDLFPPGKRDLEDKGNGTATKTYPSDTGSLPMAKLCPELGKVIILKDNSDHKGGSSA